MTTHELQLITIIAAQCSGWVFHWGELLGPENPDGLLNEYRRYVWVYSESAINVDRMLSSMCQLSICGNE